MCFSNTLSIDAISLQNRYNAVLEDHDEFEPVYHASAFSFPVWPVITNTDPSHFNRCNWGLVPSWAKLRQDADEIKKLTVNARSESVFEKPSFRHSIQKKRCLIPSTGFFEWRSFQSKKYPYFISLADADIFSIAGIWDSWTDRRTGEIVSTFSLLTVAANPLMAKIHNGKKRMPVLLPAGQEKRWLDDGLVKEEILALCVPFDENRMKAHTVGRLITSRAQDPNVPEVQKEFTYPELAAL
jgi:putative SOS response-associated peptidase YedK